MALPSTHEALMAHLWSVPREPGPFVGASRVPEQSKPMARIHRYDVQTLVASEKKILDLLKNGGKFSLL